MRKGNLCSLFGRRDLSQQPQRFQAALRAHRYSDKSKLEENVFDLAYSIIAPAMPAWGDLNQES